MITFEEFYRNLGLSEYPFAVYTTELEIEKAEELFYPSAEYGPIIESFKSKRSVIVLGERGVGKTAIKEEFIRQSKKSLVSVITNFEDISISPSPSEIYKLYVESLIKEAAIYLYKNPLSINRLNKRDKIYFSFLVYYFSTNDCLELLKEEISKIQKGIIKRSMTILYNKVRGVANYAATVAENALKRFIAQQLGTLAVYDNTEISTFFPELKLKYYLEYEERDVSYKEIERICELIYKLTREKPTLIIDSVDEDERIQNDEDIIANFTEKILSNTKLLRYQGLHQVFFIWSTPYRLIQDSVRQNKFYTPEIKWNHTHLKELANRRLSSYSKSKNLCVEDVIDISEEELYKYFEITNGIPIDLWHFFNKAIEEQYQINPESLKITQNAFDRALERLVRETNYYEYYPRKSNARADSMDVYSYYRYLKSLGKSEFTKHDFRHTAGAGGSTPHYLRSMEKIGLIHQFNSGQGQVKCKIRDKKIEYAVLNGLELDRP